MAFGPAHESDPLDSHRVRVEEAAEPEARLRGYRPIPGWVDRPRGSLWGALFLAVFALLGLALLLYDLALVWRAPIEEFTGTITVVSRARESDGAHWLAIEYGGTESMVFAQLSEPTPRVGQGVTVRTHSRYRRSHPESGSVIGSTKPLFVEPDHGLGINGIVGGAIAVVSGALAATQARLALRQARAPA